MTTLLLTLILLSTDLRWYTGNDGRLIDLEDRDKTCPAEQPEVLVGLPTL